MPHKLSYSNPSSVLPIDVQTLSIATKTLDIAAYAFVAPELVAAVHARASAGVQIRLYLDRTELESEARGDATLAHSPLGQLLSIGNLQIKVKASSILMHLKSYLVDGSLLRDGSANFSDAGEEQQDNSLTLDDDTASCAAFAAKFEAMWNRTDNLTIAEAVSSHPVHSSRPTHRQ
jgi:phosphatidylserine/phosphatidylglycerophosphate/cardiolipin synthase-like enzyme